MDKTALDLIYVFLGIVAVLGCVKLLFDELFPDTYGDNYDYFND